MKLCICVLPPALCDVAQEFMYGDTVFFWYVCVIQYWHYCVCDDLQHLQPVGSPSNNNNNNKHICIAP